MDALERAQFARRGSLSAGTSGQLMESIGGIETLWDTTVEAEAAFAGRIARHHPKARGRSLRVRSQRLARNRRGDAGSAPPADDSPGID